MELNVSQLLMQPSGSSREYHLDEVVNLTEDIRGARFQGRVNLLRTNMSVWVSAILNSAIDSECGRCLTPISHPIHLEIEEEFVPTLNPMTGAKTPLPDDDDKDYCIIDENHILDLTGTIREYTIMALPMKPLCGHQCAGLCPTCGADLNVSACSCEAPMDARWAPLLELISGTSEKN
jgi:uncharacterized protein